MPSPLQVAGSGVSAPNQNDTALQSAATKAPATTSGRPLLNSSSFLAIQGTSLSSTNNTTAQSGRETNLATPSNKDSDQTTEIPDNEEEDSSTEEGASEENSELTEEEQRLIVQLRRRDAEVTRHEQAHAAAGGQYAGAPQYEYTVGPDGRRYRTEGEVPIDSSPIPGDPQATIEKLQVVRRAALAPADPSPQDQRVAAQASQGLNEARSDLRQIELEERREATTEAEEARQEEQAAGREGANETAASDNSGNDANNSSSEPDPGQNGLQFNRDGISSAQAADAFSQAAQLTPPITNGVEVITDTIQAVQISA